MIVRPWHAGCRARASAPDPMLVFFFSARSRQPDVVGLGLEAYAC